MTFEPLHDGIGQSDGWHYHDKPGNSDCRKMVTLVQRGMTWVGIRAFNHTTQSWMNNNEPEPAEVKAWRDLPGPADGFWQSGKLFIRQKGNHRP